ncbi:MAG TPA: GGDEF domain-containing protein [Planctomycetota bacterium]|nr:GGDEF domain-containing protein [Planctomycetota bacterium]
MARRWELFLALAAGPAAAGAYLWEKGAGPVALGVAAYAVGLAAAAAFVFRRPAEFAAVARAAAEREREGAARLRELQGLVDLLSAEREIGLVLNEDVDFRAVLDRVLAIACDTLGGAVELWMRGEGGRLSLRAVRQFGKTEFDPGAPEDPGVRRCLEAGRVVLEAEEGRLRALAPLQADREVVGVVRVTAPPEPDAAAREERARILSRHLGEFSKFLGLALKTPDLYTRAVQDGLTGLWTKRHFALEARQAIEAARRYGEPLSLIMVDVDHFKKVNDTHGHVTGDRVLQGVAEILRKKVRGGSAFRYGGEEMAVLLPKADLAAAARAAERLRAAVEARKIAGIRVTASFGVAQWDPSMADPAAFVERADQALYRAKEAGRNRVETAPAGAAAAPARRAE